MKFMHVGVLRFYCYLSMFLIFFNKIYKIFYGQLTGSIYYVTDMQLVRTSNLFVNFKYFHKLKIFAVAFVFFLSNYKFLTAAIKHNTPLKLHRYARFHLSTNHDMALINMAYLPLYLYELLYTHTVNRSSLKRAWPWLTP